MVYRPRDICSAAFFDDVPRLRLLACQDAPGGLEYRFDLNRFLAKANFASAATTAAAAELDMPAEEDEEDEMEFEDDLEARLAADDELARLRRLYTLEEEEIDDDDAAAAAAEDADEPKEDDGLYDPEVVEADMAAQDADFNHYKRLLRHQLREKAVADALNKHGLLVSGDSAAQLESFGVMFVARALALAQQRDPPADAAAAAVGDGEGPCQTPLAVRWLPTRDSPYAASPLHWAVLGRAHDAVRFLVASGIDVGSTVGQQYDAKQRGSGGGDGFTFPPGLTVERVADMNESAETLRVLRAAVAEREGFLAAFERAKQQVESSLEQRKARQEKRRLARDQRRVAREERLAVAEEQEEDEEGSDSGRGGSGGDTDADTDY